MSTTEARIFTLEARLRSEENTRNDQINKIYSIIDTINVEIKSSSENLVFSRAFPNINSSNFISQTPDLKSQDKIKKIAESIQPSPVFRKSKEFLPKNAKVTMSVESTRLYNPNKKKFF